MLLGRRQLLLAAGAAAAGCAVPPPKQEDAAAALRRLMIESDEAVLERHPIFGLYRGDLRRASGHGDFISAAYVDNERRVSDVALAELVRIPRDALDANDRVAYDPFRWTVEERRDRHSPPASRFWPHLKIDQQNGWHLFFPELSSGNGIVPYRTVADYDAGLSRIDGFVGWLDRAVARMREGMVTGVVQPRFVVDRAIVQFERFAAQPLDESPHFRPLRKLPAEIPADDAERLRTAYTRALEEELRPAFRRTLGFLRDEYRGRVRPTSGLAALSGGAGYYRFLIRSQTTLPLAAPAIHRLGVAEVERIQRGIASVMSEVCFRGSRSEFFDMLRTDKRFVPTSAEALAEALAEAYLAIGRRVDVTLGKLFDTRPAAPLAVRRTPAESAPNDAAALHARRGGTRQARHFYFNTFDLARRPTWGMETLYLHEAVPGHHFEVMLARENAALPPLQRFVGNSAFSEGWALYAESLGFELGLVTDPYQRAGHYNDELLRAMRLVVDTGLHDQGWTREQAIAYMLANSAMGEGDVVSEVERYIVNPGQALAYKIGALTIRRLRERAERVLGPRFDVRAFHRQVLGTGGVPMQVLEAKIEAWVAAGG